MKKSIFLVTIASAFLSSSSFAFDFANYLNPKLPGIYSDLKTNMDSGCQFRNPFTGNCVLFWTQYNKYHIVRDNISNEVIGQYAGNATIPITCHIVRHKLDGATNPDTTNGIETGQEEYGGKYSVKFSWYVSGSPGNQVFYIDNKKVNFQFISGERDNVELADEYCTKGIVNALLSLDGALIP